MSSENKGLRNCPEKLVEKLYNYQLLSGGLLDCTKIWYNGALPVGKTSLEAENYWSEGRPQVATQR